MVFGMIEFGRAIMVQQVLTNASREGARVAILDSPTPNARRAVVTSTVNGYLQNAGLSTTTPPSTDEPHPNPPRPAYGDR